MYEDIISRLRQQELLSEAESEHIRQHEVRQPFSLHWELKTLLYLGVLLLNVGLGLLIYEYLDKIGHAVLIGLIGAVSAACFVYAYRRRRPFSWGMVISPTPYYDYILLLGCLTFLIMEGYLQFQYQLFGTRYGLATFLPMVLFFAVAYRFDHRGVLSLAITLLASWVGISVTPQEFLRQNDFDSATLVYTGVGLGIFLSAFARASEKYALKQHFAPTYLHFAVHLLLASCLAGMMVLDRWVLFSPLLALGVAFFVHYARSRQSYYFLTVAVLYGYIGLTYLIFAQLVPNPGSYFVMLYFLLSGAGVIFYFLNLRKLLKPARP